MSHERTIGTFTLAMITTAAIVSLRNLPLSAELGFSAVFYLLVAGLIFFIPVALATAELAAAWPKPGGCYIWVSEAFGKPAGLFVLWLSWMASVVWFPVMLIFTATMVMHIAEPFYPEIFANNYIMVTLILVIFWGATLSNFFGISVSGLISSIGVVFGTIIPGVLIIALGLGWWLAGYESQIPLTLDSFIPDFGSETLVLFFGMMLGLAGVEIGAFHIHDTKDPQHSYPRAMIIAAVTILSVYILGTLAITLVVPMEDICLASGLIQAFNVFFTNVGFSSGLPIIALLLLLGSMAGINAWIIGPAKGFLVVAEDGFLPYIMHHTNKHEVPTFLLIFQGVVGSALTIFFLYLGGRSSSIWILTILSGQFTFIQYIVVLLAVLYLRHSQPEVERPFRMPFIYILATSCILICCAGFIYSYIPPQRLVAIKQLDYVLLLLSNFAVLILPPLFFIKYRESNKGHA